MTFIINYLFKAGPAPDPLWVGDVNCDGKVTLADVVYLLIICSKADHHQFVEKSLEFVSLFVCRA